MVQNQISDEQAKKADKHLSKGKRSNNEMYRESKKVLLQLKALMFSFQIFRLHGLFSGLTDEEIISQSFVFLLGGFETTSTTLTNLLYNLTINPDCMSKLVDEIDTTFPHGVSINIQLLLFYDNYNRQHGVTAAHSSRVHGSNIRARDTICVEFRLFVWVSFGF